MSRKKDKIEKWIDLDKLPRFKRGNKTCIDWVNSIGVTIPFFYNGMSGEIKILKYYPSNGKIEVYIPGYTKENCDIIYTSTLKNCELGLVLKQKLIYTHPELEIYFVNKEDMYKYYSNSAVYVKAKCIDCGYVKDVLISDLANNGFTCDRCADRNSYPNKFMTSLLEQLDCNYIPEASRRKCNFNWLQKYRFDFFVTIKNQSFFIEMDGTWHYKDNRMSGRSAQEQQKIDKIKDDLAYKNGYRVIRICCDYKTPEERFEYVKNSILNSELFDLLELKSKNINWGECNKYGLKSKLILACEYWESGIHSTSEIAKKIGVCISTVIKYLKTGADHKLCSYSFEASEQYRRKKTIENNKIRLSKPLVVLKNNNIIGVYCSAAFLESISIEVFGTKFRQDNITACCRGNNKTAYGYNMKYITQDEYNDLLLHQQHKINLKEAI